jgi:UDP-N-acetylglucosamine acyltransferase
MNIHPMAMVEPGAKIGKNVTVEAFAVVKSNVCLKDNVTIKSHAYIDGYTTIGEGTVIYPGASIGTKTQDLKFKNEKTYVNIGKNCEIREFVTINSSCGEETSVDIGDNCLIMAYCHIAHNCVVGNQVVMVNNASLAGHVIIEDCAIIGGLTGIHQFVRVGAYAMVGGMSRVTHDILPYTIGAGTPFKLGGINRIGLKRRGFPLSVRMELNKAFKIIYRSQLNLNEAVKRIQTELEPIPEIQNWLKFCQDSKRGLMCLQGVTTAEGDEASQDEEREEQEITV